jgi:DNA-binding MarR family transcriptional regulator
MTTGTGKPSLMDGLRRLRETHDNQGRLIDAPPTPVRTRPQLQFQPVDADAHQRAVDAERQRLAQERQRDESAFKPEPPARGRGARLEPRRKPQQRQQKRASSNKKAAAATREPYTHLHANAHIVWSCLAEHGDMTSIADATGLTISEVAHRLRQLENNGILRLGHGGRITVAIPAVPTAKPVRSKRRDALEAGDQAVLTFIVEYVAANGYPPGIREIAEGCHFATSSVTRHLERLDQHGYIERDAGKSRGIRLLEPPAG